MKIDKLVLDVDGVLNNGQILYSSVGKMFKIFGPHDKDGLKIINRYINDITFISADLTGWDITYARIVKDWGFDETQLLHVTEENRMAWFNEHCNWNTTAFIADGYNDAPILRKVAVGIAPATARIEARQAAKWVTPSAAGNGAVLDACLYIERLINKYE